MSQPLDIEEGGGHYVAAPPPEAPEEGSAEQQVQPQVQEPIQQQPVQVQEQAPVQVQEPIQQAPQDQDVEQQAEEPAEPAAPHSSSSFWMGQDWNDAEQEKVRSARSKVIAGIAKVGSGLAGAATAAANYLKADTTQDDPDADDQTKMSGWLTFTGATIAAGWTMTGLVEIYDGIRTWRAQIRAHETRLLAEAADNPRAQQVLNAVEAVEQAVERLQVVIEALGEEHQNLQAQQGV